MLRDGRRYWLNYDQIGSLKAVVGVVDDEDRIVKALHSDAFGTLLADSNPDFTVPLGYGGGLPDRHTGLVRFGLRDYDPDVGRWTAKDPIGYAGGDNDLYGYCLDDPINGVDPEGLNPLVIGGAVLGAGVNGWRNWDDWRSGKLSGWQYLGTIGVGAGAGALSAMGGGLVTGALMSGAAGAANEAATQIIKEGKVTNGEDVAWSGAAGAFGNIVGRGSASIGKNIIWGIDSVGKPLGTPIKDAGKIGAIVGGIAGSNTIDLLERGHQG